MSEVPLSERASSVPGVSSAARTAPPPDGYDAYFGSYTVDDVAGTVTQRLLGALSPENVGLVLTRSMRVLGG